MPKNSKIFTSKALIQFNRFGFFRYIFSLECLIHPTRLPWLKFEMKMGNEDENMENVTHMLSECAYN